MKNLSVGFITSPSSNITTKKGSGWDKYKLYNDERLAIREDFRGLNMNDTDDPIVSKKLKSFARKVIETVVDVLPSTEVIDIALPRQDVGLGITIEAHEIAGAVVHEGVYGGAVRMSKPILTPFILTTKLKEVGQELVLADIQSGKYSPTEIGDYVGLLIGASRNRLLFSTLEAMSAYAGTGTQVTGGGGLSMATMITGYSKLSDGSDAKVLIGRRRAILDLSSNSAYSPDTKREFELNGQIAVFGGIPVVKVNSFTDPEYGFVYPMSATDLWMFSEQPAGRFGVTQDVTSSSEVIMRRQTMNIYWRWDDGVAIWKTNRICRFVNLN